jgi:hypothetical protein
MLELFVIFYLITEILKLPLWYVENLYDLSKKSYKYLVSVMNLTK